MYVNEKKVFLKKQFSQCEMLIGNEKKKKCLKKIDRIDITMLIYPIKNGQICIHRA